MSEKKFKYDSRYDELVEEVEKNNEGTDKKCNCYYSNPQRVQVGTQSDRQGNTEPIYVQVSTCGDCGAKEIW